ncbi:MAG: hypothetical protein OIF55_16810 [Amphritea sp.]|nr:hypothetical protein [Amphritea sp.]
MTEREKLEQLIKDTNGEKSRKWYAEQMGVALHVVDHAKLRLGFTGYTLPPVAAPEGATHQHKTTDQFMRVSGNRLFRLAAGGGWALSTLSLKDEQHSLRPLEGVSNAA